MSDWKYGDVVLHAADPGNVVGWRFMLIAPKIGGWWVWPLNYVTTRYKTSLTSDEIGTVISRPDPGRTVGR